MRALGWWCVALPLLPVLLAQALYTRRTVPRLPEACDSASGVVGEGRFERSVWVIGESTAASVGVASHAQGLAAQWASALAAAHGWRVKWHTRGENGIRLAEALERLLPETLEADAVLICFGVNDATSLTALAAWRGSVIQMLKRYQHQPVRLIVSGLPPMQDFTALPWPLRSMLGWRARLLDQQLQALCGQYGAVYAPVEAALGQEDLAEDGYHPSAQGYALWGASLTKYAE